jgi:cytochrome b561
VSAAPARYGGVAIALHWLAALAVAATFPLGVCLADLPTSPRKAGLADYHRWIGVTVFALTGVRLAWRLLHRPPSLPAAMPRWQLRAATASHWTLYGLLLAIPLTGWLYSSAAGLPTVYLGLWRLPDGVGADEALAAGFKLAHVVLNFALLAFVIVHVAAAVKHQFVGGDGLLARMLPGGYFGSSGSGGSERR